MRNARPDSIQDTVRQSITAAGGLEAASSDLGLSVSSLSRASACEDERPGGLGINHLHRMGRIVPEAAVPIASHFARLAGGIFQPFPMRGTNLAGINSLMKEFSDVLDNHVRCHSEVSENPATFTPQEARAQLKEIDELLQAGSAYRAGLVGLARGDQ